MIFFLSISIYFFSFLTDVIYQYDNMSTLKPKCFHNIIIQISFQTRDIH